MNSSAVSISFALLISAAIASAQAPHVVARLSYSAETTIADCPDEASLRAAVSSQLDYDPFAQHDSPNRFITASIVDRDSGLRATVRATDEAGQVIGSRVIESEHKDCAELASSVALAIAVAIDPLVLARPMPTPASPASPPTPPPNEEASPAPPSPPRSTPSPDTESAAPSLEDKTSIQALTSIGPFVAFGAEPSTTLGIALSGGLRRQWLSVHLEGSADLPGEKEREAGGRVESYSTMGSLLPCAHRSAFALCAVISGGARHGRSMDIAHPKTQTSLRADVGLRGAAELDVTTWLAARAHADLMRTLTKTTLEVDGEPVWTSPAVSGTVGFAAVVKF